LLLLWEKNPLYCWHPCPISRKDGEDHPLIEAEDRQEADEEVRQTSV